MSDDDYKLYGYTVCGMSIPQDEYQSIECLAKSQNLINCYQIQVTDGKGVPVFIGSYAKDDIPVPINQRIKFNDHILHVITHVLTQEEFDARIFKIIGIISIDSTNKHQHSLDLIIGSDNKYYLTIDDCMVENVELCPSKEEIIEYMITKSFADPYKKILFNES